MPAMNYVDSNRTNTVISNISWTVYTRHLVAVPFTAFGKFWIDFELFVFERDILKQRYGC